MTEKKEVDKNSGAYKAGTWFGQVILWTLSLCVIAMGVKFILWLFGI